MTLEDYHHGFGEIIIQYSNIIPFEISFNAKFEPIKPAPPVINTFFKHIFPISEYQNYKI